MAEKPAEKPKTPTEAKRIEARELREQLSKGNVVVLDMRRDWDQSSTKIRSAIRVHPDDYKEYEGSLPRGRMIVSYCTWPNEGSSARAAQYYAQKGFDARALRGGFKAWEDAKYETEPKGQAKAA